MNGCTSRLHASILDCTKDHEAENRVSCAYARVIAVTSNL